MNVVIVTFNNPHLSGEEAAAGGDPAEEEARGGGQHGQPAHPHPGPAR